MICSPVPTVSRSPGMKGFQKRTRFTFLLPARTMMSRHDWLPARKRSRTETSTCDAGLIFAGARTRLLREVGSAKLRINQPPNHPGVICPTGDWRQIDLVHYAEMLKALSHAPGAWRRLPIELFIAESCEQPFSSFVVCQ